jgi:chromosome segregation ATPase
MDREIADLKDELDRTRRKLEMAELETATQQQRNAVHLAHIAGQQAQFATQQAQFAAQQQLVDGQQARIAVLTSIIENLEDKVESLRQAQQTVGSRANSGAGE